MHEPVLLREVPTIDDWWEAGGGIGLDRAQELGPGGTLQELSLSGLRGRGGAGFPTARKWRSIAQARPETGERYVVVNAAEGEPGTFKDRALIRANPYQLIEGAAIAAITVGAAKAYIGLKRTFRTEIDRLERALTEMEAAGLTAGVDLRAGGRPRPLPPRRGDRPAPGHRGRGAAAPLGAALPAGPVRHRPPGGLVLGPQEGRRAARTRPTRPWSTTWRPCRASPRSWPSGPSGTARWAPRSRPGPIVCTVVGDVVRPTVVEVEMGTPLIELIAVHAGGLAEGRYVKAVLSGLRQPGPDRRRPGRPGELRGPAGRRRRAGLGRLHRLRRPHEHGRGGPPGQQLPLRRELRAVLTLQAGLRGHHRAPRPHRPLGRRRQRRRGHRGPAADGHRRQPLLPGHPGAGADLQHPAPASPRTWSPRWRAGESRAGAWTFPSSWSSTSTTRTNTASARLDVPR